jgi:hypothetical protein
VHFTLFVDGYFVNPYDATCYIALEEKQQPYSTARAMLHDGQGFPATMRERTTSRTIAPHPARVSLPSPTGTSG